MKYVFVGKGYEPTFGTVGRVEYGDKSTVVDPTAIFTTAVHQKEYSALCKELIEYREFIQKCCFYLKNKELYFVGEEGIVAEPPSKFNTVIYDEDLFDELMFFMVNGNWSYAMNEYGDTWVILNKSQTNVTAQRLDEFLREKFSQGEYQ